VLLVLTATAPVTPVVAMETGVWLTPDDVTVVVVANAG
jgi:hypothetical protein